MNVSLRSRGHLRLLAGQYIDMAKKHEWGCKVLYRLRYPALVCSYL